jgi:aspartyl-tRNA(Asn)/glutamyl-tRNA(Gln) amidotransferase subunit A
VRATQFWEHSATELSALIERKKISPVELLNDVISRCESLNPRLNAIVVMDLDGARAAARASEARAQSGSRLGPLDGLPVTIKDNIFVRGMPATWGSLLYRDFRPEHDDIAVARLRAAGAVIVGKTNTPEFALASFTDNLVFGPTRNPWNLDLTPGGSSGGAVTAIAAGMVPLAIGTDAGGSIRRPASYTGVVGFRPSTGRVARVRGFAPLAHDFQVIAPAARTVSDTELLYRCIAGPDPRDRASLAFGAQPPPLPARPRVRYVATVGEAPVDSEIRAAVEDAVSALPELGFIVEEGKAPYDLTQIEEVWGTLSASGLARVLAGHADRTASIHPGSAAIVERGNRITAVEYVRALDSVTELRRRIAQAFNEFDFLVMPASAALPWPVGEPYPHEINGAPASPRAAAIFATFVNAAGLPAVSLPVGPASSGLPIGMQCVGRFGMDDAVLSLAAAYEAARPWSAQWPPIARSVG